MRENEAINGLKFLKEKLFNGIYKDKLECIDKAIKALENQESIKEILTKRDNAFEGQEFGASYGDLDGIIEEIREVIDG